MAKSDELLELHGPAAIQLGLGALSAGATVAAGPVGGMAVAAIGGMLTAEVTNAEIPKTRNWGHYPYDVYTKAKHLYDTQINHPLLKTKARLLFKPIWEDAAQAIGYVDAYLKGKNAPPQTYNGSFSTRSAKLKSMLFLPSGQPIPASGLSYQASNIMTQNGQSINQVASNQTVKDSVANNEKTLWDKLKDLGLDLYLETNDGKDTQWQAIKKVLANIWPYIALGVVGIIVVVRVSTSRVRGGFWAKLKG